jgi:hypothetical protein
MSERLSLRKGDEIRDWANKNGFDVVSFDPDAPRFFQPRFTPATGPMFLFDVEHTYLGDQGKQMVSVKRVFRATTAEDALQQYLREPKERSAGSAEEKVGFRLHLKAGATEGETITVTKQPASP